MSKKELVEKIKTIFNNNSYLSTYSPFLCEYLFDEIFNCYVKEYVGNVDENDVELIKNIIEKSLEMKLGDFLSVDELYELYLTCKEYIKILIQSFPMGRAERR
jgi:hypothetical protein